MYFECKCLNKINMEILYLLCLIFGRFFPFFIWLHRNRREHIRHIPKGCYKKRTLCTISLLIVFIADTTVFPKSWDAV